MIWHLNTMCTTCIERRIAVILSVSRRTDIPNYYSEWFFNRIKEGFVYVRNPMNAHQVSKIDITPEVVDCIVFWTKNPEPMLSRLDELVSYDYYFQFTLTGYGKDMESNVPHKKEKMIPIFQELSMKIGMQKVIWRYDPIIFTKKYTPQYHLKAFEQIAAALKGYTGKCVISFVDVYAKNKKNMELIDSYDIDKNELLEFAKCTLYFKTVSAFSIFTWRNSFIFSENHSKICGFRISDIRAYLANGKLRICKKRF